MVLNSAVLSSTVNPALKGELNPPVKLVMSVLNVSKNHKYLHSNFDEKKKLYEPLSM